MHYIELKEHLPKIFTVADVQSTLKTTKTNAKMLCSRYSRSGYFLRIKKDLYIWKKDFKGLSKTDMNLIASKIQHNSYVSFYTALSHHIVYHVHSNCIQSVTLTRSSEIKMHDCSWKFFKFPKKYYFGFETTELGYCLAEPEKAIVDIIYMNSIGKHFDYMKQINLEHLSQEKMLKYAEVFPKRTQKLLKIFIKYAPKKGPVMLKEDDYDENDL